MNGRIISAERALSEYCRSKREPLNSLETGIIDLMTDLLHLARTENLDGFQLAKMAQMHFLVEEKKEHSVQHNENTKES
jgi:hypothetical protein